MPFNHSHSLLELVRSEKKGILNLYFYAILSGCFQLSIPIGIQAIVGFVTGASMSTSIYILILGLVLAVTLVGTLNISQMKQVEQIQRNLFTYYAYRFTESFPRFNLKKTDHYYLPEKANRFFDTVSLQKGFSKILLDIPQASIQIILGMLLISFYHPVFIAFSVILLLVLVSMFLMTGKKGIATSNKESTYKYALVDWLEEIARSIKAFKFSQGSHLNLKKADQPLSNYLEARQAHFNVLLLQYRTLLVVKVFITAAMLFTGTYLLVEQTLNIGEFIAAEIVILTIISAVEKLISNLDSIYDVATAIYKLSDVLDIEKEQDGKVNVSVQSGITIQLQHLSFNYEGQRPCLVNLNIHVKGNSSTVIHGEDGSGKSTLMNILNGNFREFDGAFILNDIPIQNYSLLSLRNNTGYFSFEPKNLFKATLWDNISMGHDHISAEEVYRLVSLLKFNSSIFNEGEGLENNIFSEGMGLTSTEIHRILLLRTLIRRPALLLLEEPFDRLPQTEKTALADYLIHLKNTTIIVITSDPYFNQSCPNHITLQKPNTNDI